MSPIKSNPLFLAIALLAGCGGPANQPDGGNGPDPGMSAGCGDTTVRAHRRIRRLTRFEFDNTVADLLRIPSSWGQSFPPDDVVAGFDNNGAALRVGPLLADKLLAASEAIAEASAKNLVQFEPCAANGNDDCARKLIGTLGGRAFRRPIEKGEQDRYFAVYQAVAKTDGFGEGAKAVVAALVQSPNFLYRTELGGAPAGPGLTALTDHEIASELSYLFWSSMPDDELLGVAAAGKLHSPEAIAAQARRLLASPKSRPMLDHFAAQWLSLDTINRVSKDPKYTDFTPAIRAAMTKETLDWFDHVVRGGTGKLPELFVTRESIVTPELATFYGLPGAPIEVLPDGSVRRDVSAAHRGGLLANGSILASMAKPNSASPVHRGKLVREKILCGFLPPPPAGLNLQLAPVDPSMSNRDRFTMHASNPTCASCHSLIDKIGFGFERFDAVGRYQETDNGHAIDDTGEIIATRTVDGTFHGVLDLEERLAKSDDVSACFARQWVTYGYGQEESQDTACLISRATTAFRGSDLTIADLLVALTQSPDFRLRLADGDMPPPDMAVAQTDGGTPPPPPDLAMGSPDLAMSSIAVNAHEDSRWQTGLCMGVVVTNNGQAPVEWAIPLHVEGKINNLWNAAQKSLGGDLIEFSGLSYNHTIQPGGTVNFGWCATLP